MAQTIPPALEQELQKFDTMRRNLETLQTMAQTMQSELSETKATLEELKKQPEFAWRREGDHITLRQPFRLDDVIGAARELVG